MKIKKLEKKILKKFDEKIILFRRSKDWVIVIEQIGSKAQELIKEFAKKSKNILTGIAKDTVLHTLAHTQKHYTESSRKSRSSSKNNL